MRSMDALVKAFLAGWRGILFLFWWITSRPLLALQWLGGLRADAWMVEGKERNSGLPLSVVCALNEDDRIYVLSLLFGDSYRQRRLGRFWSWDVAGMKAEARTDVSLVLTEAFEFHPGLARRSDVFFIPLWLLGEVHLPRTAEDSHKVSGDLRRIRRHGLQCEITRDPGQFDDFYDHMLIPYATQRFGVCAEPAPYKSLKNAFPACDLVVIKSQETSVAGQLIYYGEENPHLWEMGVRDGNGDYVKDGAGCALYHYGLQHLQQSGYRKAWLGWSRPMLRNGVLQYKRKWSQELTITANYGCVFRVWRYTPAVKAFLCQNPFVFKRGGLCYGAVFVDGQRPLTGEEVRQLYVDYFHPGMARLLIYDLEPAHASAPSPIPADLAEHVEMRSALDLPRERSSGNDGRRD